APYTLPPRSDPKERAKEASGLRYNAYTKGEIDTLQKLTAAGCSATPQLLGVKYDLQDSSILESNSRPATGGRRRQDIDWWIPGGYIVYILMTRLQAQPLGINTFWDERLFTKQDRDDIREAFQRSFVYHYTRAKQNPVITVERKDCVKMPGLTSEELTNSRVPSINENPARTVHASQSSQLFIGTMARWVEFEKEVRVNRDRQPWTANPIMWKSNNWTDG
ncbi:MAG: hypothetical protein Q9198_006188, partial [Flavoplaca austrocitrina]